MLTKWGVVDTLKSIMKERRHTFVIVTISTIIFTAIMYLWFMDLNIGFHFFRDLDLKFYDVFLNLRGQRDADERVVIVAIDEKSLEQIGRWPWKRSVIAEGLKVIEKDKPKAIGLDIVFAEPEKTIGMEKIENLVRELETVVDHIEAKFQARKKDLLGRMEALTRSLYLLNRHAPSSLRKRIISVGNQVSSINKLMKELDVLEGLKEEMRRQLGLSVGKMNNDEYLAQTISQYDNIVLGYFFYTRPEELKTVDLSKVKKLDKYILQSKIPVVLEKDKTVLMPYNMLAMRPNIEVISRASKYSGFFNALPDNDGIFRHGVLIAKYGDYYLPSLSLEMLVVGLGEEPVLALLSEGAYLRLGDISIPLSLKGEMFINYRGPKDTYATISFADLINGKVPKGTFKDKYVLIGATATAIYDLRPTPFDKTYPGVKVHANIIDNILNREFLTRGFGADFLAAAAMIVFWIFITVVFSRFNAFVAVTLSVAALAAYVLAAYWSFTAQRYVISVVYPSSVNVFSFVALLVFKLLTEERTRKKYREAFQRYVSASVVEEILKDPSRLKLGGEKRDLTVLFSDIRGFTNISERLDPIHVANVLHEFLTPMTEVIFDHLGMLDKYMGDAIMAVFGAPLYREDHAILACRAALTMLDRLVEINEKFRQENLPPINIGIGINSGEMVVGNMGSSMLFDYTVIGDAVNLGSRLEGLNKIYGTNIIISEFTKERAAEGGFLFRELDLVRVKGKDEPVKIYELVKFDGREDAYREAIPVFEKGLHYYRNQRWDLAAEHFETVIEILGKDAPSRLFIQRCQWLKENPPGDEWDGVWRFETK